MATEIACSTRGLTVAYNDKPVLQGVDFSVPAGTVMGIVGPNGAGKSTLIKAMLGLLNPLAGSVEFFDSSLDEVRNRVGYMPQTTSVDWDFPTTVRDVVTMGTYGGLSWLRRPGKAEKERVTHALEEAGIADLASRHIGQLSGGQKQRVFLARTLVAAPDLYMMDEPFQGIDARTQEAMMGVLNDLRQAGKTIVIVHHDLATVRDYCDQVTLLNRVVISSGPVQEAFTRDHIRQAYDGATMEFLS